MEKMFIYGFNLQFLFEKIKPKLSEHYDLKYYNGFTKIKQRNFILSPLIVLISLFSAFFKIVTFKPNYIMLVSSKPSMIGPLMFFFKKKIKIIYFPYDAMCLNYKNYKLNPFYDRIWEGYCYKVCSGIIFKGGEFTEVKNFFDIEHKPHLKINLLTLKNTHALVEKTSPYLKVCYIGYTLIMDDNPDYVSDIKILKKFVNQKIFVQVYSPEKNRKYFSDIITSKYFKFTSFVKNEVLIKEIRTFDYGLHITYLHKNAKLTEEMYNTTMANREYDYLQAGLPIIVGDSGNISNFVTENKIGFAFSLEQLDHLDKDLLLKNRNAFKENIELARRKYAFENQIPEFLEFMKKVKEVK